MANPQVVIPQLAHGAVAAHIRNGAVNPLRIEFDAIDDCLVAFVKMMERQPNWKEIRDIHRAVKNAIDEQQASAPESEAAHG